MTPVSYSVAAALAASGGGTLAAGSTIVDTAANVSDAIDSLLSLVTGGKVTSISLSNGGKPIFAITVQQASADAAVLAAITTTYTLSQRILAANAGVALSSGFRSFAVVDSSANVVANLGAIEGIFTATNQLGTIRLTDAAPRVLTMSAATLATNVVALGFISNPFTIALTDSGTPVITVPNFAVSFVSYNNVIGRVTTPFILNADGFFSPITTTTVETGVGRSTNADTSPAAGTLNPIAPLGRVSTALLPSNISTWTSAPQIAYFLPGLEIAAEAGKLVSVISYGAGFTASLALATSDLALYPKALAKISPNVILSQLITASQAAAPPVLDPHFRAYAVQDTESNVLANIASIDALARRNLLAMVTLPSPTPDWVMTAAQFAQAALVLGFQNYNVANVITLSDPGVPTVTLSADVFSNSVFINSVLPYVTNAFHLVITGFVSASVAATIANTASIKALVTSFKVFDSASNISANIAALQTLATSGALTSIAVSGGGVTRLSTAVTVGADAAALAKFNSPYVIGTPTTAPVTTTIASFLAGISSYEAQAEGATLGTVTFSDAGQQTLSLSAAVLAANLVAISAISPSVGVSLTDSGTPSFALAAWQLTTATIQLLSRVSGSFTFSVSGPVSSTIANAIGTSNLVTKLSAGVAIQDIGGAFVNTLAAGGPAQLAAAGRIASVTFLDGFTAGLVVSPSLLATNVAVIAAITSPYELLLPVSAAVAATTTVPQGSYTRMLVFDTAANILANAASLEKLAAGGRISFINVTDSTTLNVTAGYFAANYEWLNQTSVTSITLTDGGTPAIHLQDWQFDGSLTLLGKIQSPFTWDITGPIRANRAATISNNATLLARITKQSLLIRDTAGSIPSRLAQFNTLYAAGVINHVELRSGPGTNILVLTAAQRTTYGALLNATVTTPYTLALPTTVAGLATATLSAGYGGFGVSDTVANVLANLATLKTLDQNNQLANLSFTDAAPRLVVSAATLSQYANVLGTNGGGNYPVVLTDAGTPTVSITGGQLGSGNFRSNILDSIGTNFQLVITSAVTASTWASVVEENNGALAHLTGQVVISDYSFNVASYLDQLEAGLRSGKVASVTLIDGGTPTLKIQQYQQQTDTTALSTGIISPYTVSVISNVATSSSTVSTSTAQDGYIAGATVGYDNGSGGIDYTKPTTTTDAKGGFSLSGGTGPLLLIGGTDSATGLAFTGVLRAPAGSTVLSPLTTLVQAVLSAGASSIASANASVVAALGLTVGTDLTTLDAVAGTLAGDAAATKAFQAAALLQNTLSLITAVGGAGAASLSIATLAQTVKSNTAVNLADQTTVSNLAASAGLSTAAATTIGTITANTAAALATQLSGVTTPTQLFLDITGASIAQQGNAAAAITLAVQTNAPLSDVATNYTNNLPSTLGSSDNSAASNLACFAVGTRIATARGMVRVEALEVGDQAVLAAGGTRPIIWIGSRTIDCSLHARPDVVWPVSISPHAIAPGVPARLLRLSPEHSVFMDGCLIPVRELINGGSIDQIRANRITYYHIELDSHDVVLAENLPVESYLESDNRDDFGQGGVVALHPAFAAPNSSPCAPIVRQGPVLQTVRTRLAERSAGQRVRVARQ